MFHTRHQIPDIKYPLIILYEDDQILVIDKPAGLVVTPGPCYEEKDTLVGRLIDRYGEKLRKVGSGDRPRSARHRPGIVHRLDKDTSGVMVIAKTQPAFVSLVSQFKARKVFKEYLALVWGSINAKLKIKNEKLKKLDEIESSRREDRSVPRLKSNFEFSSLNFKFILDAPIGRNPKNRLKFAVVEGGKSARTLCKVLNLTRIGERKFSLLACYPKTGRTHQIRVHLKSFGHGVVGDAIYQSRSEKKIFEEMIKHGILKDRMYLHARRLGIVAPGEEKRRLFKSAVPKAFQSLRQDIQQTQ